MAEQDTLRELDALIERARSRLAQNPDYIALQALEKARAEIANRSVSAESKPVILTQRTFFGGPKPKAPSQLEASATALDQAGHPLPTPELVMRVRQLGARVGGSTPTINLGSTLSRSAEFRSVRWEGRSCWWFVDRPLPTESSRRAAE